MQGQQGVSPVIALWTDSVTPHSAYRCGHPWGVPKALHALQRSSLFWGTQPGQGFMATVGHTVAWRR